MNETIDRDSFRPVKIKNIRDKSELKKVTQGMGFSLVDQIEDFLLELFQLRNPKYKFIKEYSEDFLKFKLKYLGKKEADSVGNWFYYPWLKTVIHFLPENEHFELRTGRNKNLITKEEQEIFYNSSIAVLGMSVGSHAALTIAMTGGAKYLTLADLDVIGGSNLNRIRTGYQNIGVKKVVAVAREVYQMNPYAEVRIFDEGVTEENLETLFGGKCPLQLIVEEMDNPYFKMRVREIARSKRIPVIMAADHQDSCVVDVERFDISKKLPLLHGLLGDKTSQDFKQIVPTDIPKIVSKMAGANFSSLRMLESDTEVGKSLYSWPQLGTAATLCGSVLAQLARRIILKEKIASGRYDVNVERFFFDIPKKDALKRSKMLKMLGII